VSNDKTVLVIDDSSLVRRQVRAALEASGVSIVEAADGLAALELLAAREVHLVITDFTMPRMSGIELLEALRSQATQREVPVIVLSTQGQAALVQRGWELGVKAWLKKPFKPALLASAVLSLLPT
jgi:two-component system chemotaxis response regulator CheY